MANQKTKVIWVLCFIFPFASKEKQLITQTNQSTVLNIMLSFLSFSYIFLPTKHRRINTPNSQNQTTKTLNHVSITKQKHQRKILLWDTLLGCWESERREGKHVKMRSKYYHFWVPNRPTGSCGFWRRKRQESLCIYKERELAVKP